MVEGSHLATRHSTWREVGPLRQRFALPPPRAGEDQVTEPAPSKSDLGVRVVSAVVMIAVAAAAWFGGPIVWSWFVIVVGVTCFGELARLVWKAFSSWWVRVIWILFGFAYVAIAVTEIDSLPFGLIYHGHHPHGGQLIGLALLISVVGLVVCTDVGAYFTGRTFGGPKIAPTISPSKTWAGLVGGMICAGLWGVFAVGLPSRIIGEPSSALTAAYGWAAASSGAAMAIVAQAGDFLESWIKRRANVKDSSRLIPGHGGVFDRVDGLLAVALVSALSGDWLIFGELLRQ